MPRRNPETTFDVLAQVVERYIPSLVSEVESSKLFIFPGIAHELLPKEYSIEEQQMMIETFFLPFRRTAVEDPAGVVILYDIVKDQEGLDRKRRFIDCVNMTASPEAFSYRGVGTESPENLQKMFPPNTVFIKTGIINHVAFKPKINQFYEEATMYNAGLFSPDEGCLMDIQIGDPDLWQAALDDSMRNTLTAIQEVLYFNTPTRFIMEETPRSVIQAKQKKKKKRSGDRVRRSHQRPLYTLLKPKEIRKKMGLPPLGRSGGGERAPHWRRKHYRLLSSERYVKMKGKKITVKAAWVGPEEAMVGNKRYKVLLDK